MNTYVLLNVIRCKNCDNTPYTCADCNFVAGIPQKLTEEQAEIVRKKVYNYTTYLIKVDDDNSLVDIGFILWKHDKLGK